MKHKLLPAIALALLLCPLPDAKSASPAPTTPPAPAASPAPRAITVNVAQVRGPMDRTPEMCVGSGNAWLGLRPDWQRQLAVAHALCGFRYLRFHGILSDEMDVYHEDAQGVPYYHWDKVDAVYGAMLKAGVKPFVEISFMPTALASNAARTGFRGQVNVSPPKDYAKWTALITAFTRHLEARFGRAEVKTWYFEVWNEPNHPGFYTHKLEDYETLYAATAPAIKSVCGDYRVGGPATAGPAWITELIDYCGANKLPLDFISTHDYGNAFGQDPAGHKIKILNPSPGAVIGIPVDTRAKIRHSAMPNLELHITEWSASYSDRDPIHDSYLEAPYILEKLKRIGGAANSMSYWTFSDVFDENGFAPSPFHGGFGLISRDGLKKPAFYAYQYLHEMGDTELANADPSSWVCRQGKTITALVWDFHQPVQDSSDTVFFARDLPTRALAAVPFRVAGLAPGRYLLALHRTGYRHNDVYDSYRDIGMPADLTPMQVTGLAAINNDAPEQAGPVTVGRDGVFEASLPMRENDVVFLSLTPTR